MTDYKTQFCFLVPVPPGKVKAAKKLVSALPGSNMESEFTAAVCGSGVTLESVGAGDAQAAAVYARFLIRKLRLRCVVMFGVAHVASRLVANAFGGSAFVVSDRLKYPVWVDAEEEAANKYASRLAASKSK